MGSEEKRRGWSLDGRLDGWRGLTCQRAADVGRRHDQDGVGWGRSQLLMDKM